MVSNKNQEDSNAQMGDMEDEDVRLKKTSERKRGKEEKLQKEKKRRKQQETEDVAQNEPESIPDKSDGGSNHGDNGYEESLAVPLGSSSTREAHKDEEEKDHDREENYGDDQRELSALEYSYFRALQEFKADKSNKEKRRLKTAAKRAWDAKRLATAEQGSEAIVCRHCSQLFIFSAHDKFKDYNWEKPVQCKECVRKIGISRTYDRTRRDEKQNMCYEFQKTGSCSRGDRCKFSHLQNQEENKRATKVRRLCRSVIDGVPCPHGDQCRFRHEKLKNINNDKLNDKPDDSVDAN